MCACKKVNTAARFAGFLVSFLGGKLSKIFIRFSSKRLFFSSRKKQNHQEQSISKKIRRERKKISAR